MKGENIAHRSQNLSSSFPLEREKSPWERGCSHLGFGSDFLFRGGGGGGGGRGCAAHAQDFIAL